MSEPSPEGLFTPTQRKLIGFAASFLAVVVIGTLFIALFALAGRLVGFFSSVLWPLAVAGILAMMLQPVVELLERRLKLRRAMAVTVLYAVFALAVGGLLLLILPPLIEQIIDLISFAPTLWDNAVRYVQIHYPAWVDVIQRQLANPTVKGVVDGFASEAKSLLSAALPSLKTAGLGALGVFGFITHLAIIPIYLFFFLLSSGDPTRRLPEHLTFVHEPLRSDLVFLVREFIAIVTSFFRGQLVIGLIMGALLAVGFTVVGLKFGLFIGLALGVLNIVPYLGTILGLSVALPLAFFQPEGGASTVAWVLGVFGLVQVVEGYYLTPKIMGDRTGLHQVVIIVAIFFWGTVFDGLLGMVMAIPLTAFFVTAWRLAQHKYFPDPDGRHR